MKQGEQVEGGFLCFLGNAGIQLRMMVAVLEVHKPALAFHPGNRASNLSETPKQSLQP
jgi:hypothetical protein